MIVLVAILLNNLCLLCNLLELFNYISLVLHFVGPITWTNENEYFLGPIWWLFNYLKGHSLQEIKHFATVKIAICNG
jgi:hypothetical protein